MCTRKTWSQILNQVTLCCHVVEWYFRLRSGRRYRSKNTKLQHIFLDILSPEECKVFAKGINPARELCAAKKIKPSLKVFNITDDEKGPNLKVIQLTTKLFRYHLRGPSRSSGYYEHICICPSIKLRFWFCSGRRRHVSGRAGQSQGKLMFLMIESSFLDS